MTSYIDSQKNTVVSRLRLIIRDSQRACVLLLTTRSAMVSRMRISFWKKGDIINVDVSTILDGYFSDASRMFTIGDVSPEAERIVRVTKECVELGLEQVKPWTPIGNMGSAVHKHAVENGYTVVREIGGHGVGLEFHEDPWVSYTSKEGSGVLMVPGMIFTIEPMVNMGSDESIQMRSMTGQCGQRMDCHRTVEIMVLVTETGHEVLCW